MFLRASLSPPYRFLRLFVISSNCFSPLVHLLLLSIIISSIYSSPLPPFLWCIVVSTLLSYPPGLRFCHFVVSFASLLSSSPLPLFSSASSSPCHLLLCCVSSTLLSPPHRPFLCCFSSSMSSLALRYLLLASMSLSLHRLLCWIFSCAAACSVVIIKTMRRALVLIILLKTNAEVAQKLCCLPATVATNSLYDMRSMIWI